MGGYGNGRSTGRPTTESGLTLTLSKVLRDGLFRRGCVGAGSLIWTNTSTGERIGSMGYEAHLCEASDRVRLYYTTTRWDGEKPPQPVTTDNLRGNQRIPTAPE
jgi:hypothetical protein